MLLSDPNDDAFDMSTEILIVCLVLTATFYYTNCCAADEMAKSDGTGGIIQDNETVLDQETIMAMCNETFRTPMGMLFVFFFACRIVQFS